ncbi:GreA/GreB family elongation factor [Herbaspirillum sp. GCM10030257]|uniref:GreA/GreB family elongation factor n=1 Tax=Herbaspirillum sp. GCM10030257 TaxID=3273393 RepID=UPI00360F3B34
MIEQTQHDRHPSREAGELVCVTLSTADHGRLTQVLSRECEANSHANALLAKKLSAARLIAPQRVPPDLVTMNSRVLFVEIDTQAVYGFTLAYPGPNMHTGEVSVLSAVGAALLGLSTGQDIHWIGASGRRLGLRVLDVIYQPEANGTY